MAETIDAPDATQAEHICKKLDIAHEQKNKVMAIFRPTSRKIINGQTPLIFFCFNFWIGRTWRVLGECRKTENGAFDNGFKVGYFG